MTTAFSDRLVEAIRSKQAPVCVGLDPLLERLPLPLRGDLQVAAARNPTGMGGESVGKALLAYGRGVIRAVAPHVPAIKINIAFFEPFYSLGIRIYYQLIVEARAAGLIVIGDVKRADIGHSSTQYAAAQLGAAAEAVGESAMPDAVTVNPYFGFEGVAPFVEVARQKGRGVFVLVQTSNPSAAEVQGLALPDGTTVCQGVARLVQEWAGAEGLIGRSGYSCIGAVVSPRDVPSTVCIRELMPSCLFLVPGFGAQGRTAEEVARCFKPDGSGAIVTASRSVIYAYEEPKYRGRPAAEWERCVADGCREFVAAVRAVVPSP